MRLGAGRPSDLIAAGKISLHGPVATRVTTGGQSHVGRDGRGSVMGDYDDGGRSSRGRATSGAARQPQSAAARMFVAGEQRVDVVVEGGTEYRRESAAAEAALERVRAGVIVPTSTVAAGALPDHLQRSGVTGEASRTLGFVSVRPAGATVAVGGASDDGWAIRGRLIGGVDSVDGVGDAAVVHDTNVNADIDDANSSGGTGMTNDALWQMLFAQEATKDDREHLLSGDSSAVLAVGDERDQQQDRDSDDWEEA